MSRASDLIFVYGSLRSDVSDVSRTQAARRAREALSGCADLVGQGDVAGRLYAVAWYPGYVPARAHTPRVRGEVWRMRDPARVLAALDPYEGSDYARDARVVRLDSGRRVSAWLYRFVGGLSRALPIATGDYLDWVRAKESAG